MSFFQLFPTRHPTNLFFFCFFLYLGGLLCYNAFNNKVSKVQLKLPDAARSSPMDHIDRKIIDILQKNARAPLKEIADHVFLSSPAVSARIARLESAGILSGYQAQIDAPKLGYMVKAFINLDMDPQRKPEFYPYIQQCPQVVECNCVTGDYSMLIEVLFGTTQELDQFINHLQQFGRTHTQIVFSTPVEHRGVPVSDPEEET